MVAKMDFFSKARLALKDFSEKLLDIDNTRVPIDQMNALYDYLTKYKHSTETEDIKELMIFLRKKHLVDSICVAETNGSIIASSNGDSLNEAVTGAALYNYVNSEVPKSEAILIKSGSWYMLFPYKKKVFIVKAGADLSPIELKAMAKEVENFLEKRRQ
jgi:hypothetical protein